MSDPISRLWLLLGGLAPEFDPTALQTSLEAAADMVRQSRRVVVCGTGKSKLAGDRLAANLRLVGYQSFSFAAADLPHGDFGAFEEGSIGIFLSSSGQDAHVVSAARRVCADFEMPGIAITNAQVSDIAEICTLMLSCNSCDDIFDGYPPVLNFYRLSIIADLLLATLISHDPPGHSTKSLRNHSY